MNILEHIISELHLRRGEWKAIAKESGVPYFTIAKISQGVTKNPRWQTVEALQGALEKSKQAA